MKKKILSIFLSLALIFVAIPFSNIKSVASEEDECSTYGHSYVEIYRLEATCETDGYIEYICQVCSGDSYQEPIPATGHSYAHLYTQDATCSQDGWSEYACMNCGNSYTDDFIPAYGCEMFASPQTPVGPFCDSYGFVEYKCDLCGKVVFTEELPPAGHSFGEWETIQYVTCAQEGINRRTCETCGETEEEIIPKNIDHAFEPIDFIPPTCISDGYMVIKCSICGFTDEIESGEISTGTEHSYSVTETVNATCFEDGYTKYTCKYCSDSYTKTITAKGSHSFGKWAITTAPTCTENGVQTRTCSVCDATETKVITAHGHNYSSEWTIEKPSTCTEMGIKSTVCTLCGAKLSETLQVADHNYGEMIYTTQPTCTQSQIGYHCCEDCGEVEYLQGYADHKFGDWVVTSLPNATLSGKKEHTCSVCGHTETEVIPPVEFALGDTSGDGVVDENDYNLIVEIATGTRTPTVEEMYAADINQDGTVDGFDVIYFDLILNNYI